MPMVRTTTPPTPVIVVSTLLSLEMKKTMEALVASCGTCSAIEMMTHKTAPPTMMVVRISRARVGASSCRNQPIQSESRGRASRNVSLMELFGWRTFDDRNGGRAHAEKIDIRIFDFDANRKALRDAHPV